MIVKPLHKILIANRGEIALRIMRTCRELGIETVAVFSAADQTAPHVLAADQSYYIGPPPPGESYLAIESLIAVALKAGVDAIHPGYGFLSENPEFARRVREAGLVFIGPTAETIAAMGDKTAARKLARSAGVPIIPGTEDAVVGVEAVEKFCLDHGFPILLKAAAGGGGKGMRIVREGSELRSAFLGARSEARSAFGDDRLFIEKYLQSPRHIEFQILGDAFGNTIHLGERECSIQRRHQKIIEESPSVAVDDELRSVMGETAVRCAMACKYVNAGTVEFLVDRDGKFYFLEMNTRLQVEHPVTEMRTGLDLVALQIRIAQGERLPLRQEEVGFRGHAIECRICAEDPANNFLPASGRICHLRTPSGPGVREDRGIEEGGEVGLYYDSLLAKLVTWAETRDLALARMRRALMEYEIVGVQTNIPLCLFVIDDADFRSGSFTTEFLHDHVMPEGPGLPENLLDASAAVSAFVFHESRKRNGQGNGTGWKAEHGDRWRNQRFEPGSEA
jgi:acetyl-CoA carboxylase biotin carboxylase subunit